MKNQWSRLKFHLWYGIGRLSFTNFLYLMYKKKYPNCGVVDKKTDIVIEGYPRCGNTYLITLLSDMQGGNEQSIAHHLHTIAQLKNAKKYQTPCVVLIRNPESSLLSLKIRQPYLSFKEISDYYIDYYTQVINLYGDYMKIVEFGNLIENPNEVIDSINKSFNFSYKTIEARSKDKIKERLIQYDKSDKGSKDFNPLTVSHPTKEKELLKNEYKSLFQKELSSLDRDNLNKIYSRVLSLQSHTT